MYALHTPEDHELMAEGWLVNSKVIWPAPIDRITCLQWSVESHILEIDMTIDEVTGLYLEELIWQVEQATGRRRVVWEDHPVEAQGEAQA